MGSEVPTAQPREREGNVRPLAADGQRERERVADVLLISEQYKWSQNSAWYQNASWRAEILVCHLDYGNGAFRDLRNTAKWGEAHLDRRGILIERWSPETTRLC